MREIYKDYQAEEKVISGLLHNKADLIKYDVKPNYFTNDLFREVVENIKQGRENAENTAYIRNFIEGFTDIKSKKVLYGIYNKIDVGLGELETAVKRIHELKVVRDIPFRVQNILKEWNKGKETPALLKTVEKELDNLADVDVNNEVLTSSELMTLTLSVMYERLEKKEVFIKTCFSKLDSVIGGLRKGAIYVVAGNTGMAKTSFSLSVVNNVLKSNSDFEAMFFSLEMPNTEIGARLLALRSGLPVKVVDSPKEGEDNLRNKVMDSADEICKENRLSITDRVLDIDEIEHECIRQSRLSRLRGKKLGVIVIDYLQVIKNRTKDDAYHFTTKVVNRIKEIAKICKASVILISQFNRSASEKENKRPKMSYLRDSGATEQVADVVIGVYREKAWNVKALDGIVGKDEDIAEISVLKNRQGGTGVCLLEFRATSTSFHELDSEKAKAYKDLLGKNIKY